MKFIDDERAAGSIGLSRFFLSVFVVGALLSFILMELGTPLLTGAQDATNDPTSNQASGWLLDFIDIVPIIMLLVGFLGIILLAIFQREVLRG